MQQELLEISRIRDTDKLQTSLFSFIEKYEINIEIYSEYDIISEYHKILKYRRSLELKDLNRFDMIFGDQGFSGKTKFNRILLKCKIKDVTYEYSASPNNI